MAEQLKWLNPLKIDIHWLFHSFLWKNVTCVAKKHLFFIRCCRNMIDFRNNWVFSFLFLGIFFCFTKLILLVVQHYGSARLSKWLPHKTDQIEKYTHSTTHIDSFTVQLWASVAEAHNENQTYDNDDFQWKCRQIAVFLVRRRLNCCCFSNGIEWRMVDMSGNIKPN